MRGTSDLGRRGLGGASQILVTGEPRCADRPVAKRRLPSAAGEVRGLNTTAGLRPLRIGKVAPVGGAKVGLMTGAAEEAATGVAGVQRAVVTAVPSKTALTIPARHIPKRRGVSGYSVHARHLIKR